MMKIQKYQTYQTQRHQICQILIQILTKMMSYRLNRLRLRLLLLRLQRPMAEHILEKNKMIIIFF